MRWAVYERHDASESVGHAGGSEAGLGPGDVR